MGVTEKKNLGKSEDLHLVLSEGTQDEGENWELFDHPLAEGKRYRRQQYIILNLC